MAGWRVSGSQFRMLFISAATALALAIAASASAGPPPGPPRQEPTNTPFSLAPNPTATPPDSSLPSPTPTNTPPEPTSTPIPLPSATPTATETDLPLTLPSPTPTDFPLSIPTLEPTDFPLLGPDEVPDLILWKMEVTQGIQNLDNDMPLVADRQTYVRVYVYTSSGVWGGVSGALEGKRNGQVLPGSPLFANNGPILARQDGGVRINRDDSLYFELPSSWLQGEITLRAFVWSGDPGVPYENEPDAENNYGQVKATFHPGGGPTVRLFPLHFHQDYDPAKPENTYPIDLSSADILLGAYRYWPVASIEYVNGPVLYPPDHDDGGEWDMGPCRTTLAEDLLFGELIEVANTSLIAAGDTLQIEQEQMNVVSVDHANNEVEVERFPQMATDQFAGSVVYILGCGAEAAEWGSILSELAAYRALSSDYDEEQFYGLIPPELVRAKFAGYADGNRNAAGWAWSGPDGTVPWMLRGGALLGHEGGHNMSVKHVNCNGEESNPDASFPTGGSNCSLAPVDPNGYYGFDVYADWFPYLDGPTAISNDPGAPHPHRAFPFMGYRWPDWTDPYTYCKLLTYYGVPCDAADLGLDPIEATEPVTDDLLNPPDPLFPPDPPSYYLIKVAVPIGDQADQADDSSRPPTTVIELVPHSTAAIQEQLQQLELVTEKPDYWLELVDGDGEPLATFPLLDPHRHYPAQGDYQRFVRWLPAVPGGEELRLRFGDGQTARYTTLARPAAREFELTLEQTTDDAGDLELIVEALDTANGQPVTSADFTLLYSPDGGASWLPLAVASPKSSFHLADYPHLPGGYQALVRVLASVGLTTVEVQSEPFSLANKPPAIMALAPGSGRVVPSQSQVIVMAIAHDAEDGTLTGERLIWQSDRDGPLGTGQQLELASLSPGLHRISLTATDSAGASTQAEIRLGVDPDTIAYQPPAELVAQVQAAFAGELAAEPEAQETAPLSPLLLALLGLALLGGGALGLALMLPLLKRVIGR